MTADRLPTIAHLLHRLDVAGAELLAVELAEALGSRYRFVFVCLDGGGAMVQKLRQQGATVHELCRRPGIDFALSRSLGRLLVQEQVQAVHAHQYTPFFYAALARMLPSAGGFRGRILFTEHGRHYPDRRKLSHLLVNRLLLRRGDAVTAVGEFVKRSLVRCEGIPEGRIQVIRNAPPTRLPGAATAEDRQAVRGELGLRMEQPVVLQVARFHPVKDHGTAIRAFAQVSRQLPEAALLLAGDGVLRAQSESLVAELGLGGCVRFLGVRPDVPRLLAAADVFLLSSLSEGISLTLLEAMQAAVPIVATDVGGNAEVVLHGQTGLLSPRQDADALAANLLTLLRDAGLRERLGAAGRAHLEVRFSRKKMIADYDGLYASLVVALTGR